MALLHVAFACRLNNKKCSALQSPPPFGDWLTLLKSIRVIGAVVASMLIRALGSYS
jgi:hypothetical protein